ncbi:putative deoxyribonuclease YjjV [Mariniflexile rhizosphaerae]|uniref:Qat anti-phage system TatD family nuclease QatD n=1 Tax=unclassified Mariniflexile TaxID=2643887 RepID=UPI000CC6D595|nr:Qat anti-phage system TatD family nuclease QatD [Mariniflexile sp. TRM1-10]AXP82147.1 putative deoxyribonuclease YjjV [Mariniflexile sp. TRM1-10]PLB20208.1 MAG: TatD-related deoxyribonuclease [Flavobacteriaceae bacterium FS1-H7996/R]
MLDTHCHIDLYPKPELILNECDKNGFAILSMTNLPSHFERGFPFFQNKNKVRQALGMHPLYAQHYKKEFPKFLQNLSKTSYIGEVGLDFSKEGIDTKEIQIRTFESILSIIADKKKLLSIHSRKAEKEVLNLLKKYKIRNAIFHWYSGGLNLIDEIVPEGYYFSINPAMVKSMSGRKIISKIPKEFILTETDGPFIEENNSPLKPGQVQTVISFLAKEWKINEEDVKKIIWSNFQNIVNRLK